MISLTSLVRKSRTVLCAVLCLGSNAVIATAAAQTEAADPLVMTINGEPVSAREYRLVMRRHTAAIYGRFSRDKKLDDHPGYWSTDSGPDGPLAMLRELVATELVKIKVSQGLARRYGLVEDTTFQTFQRRFEAENARRAEARKTGQIIYGPEHYRPNAYYYVRFRELEARLKQTMARSLEGQITDAEIDRYYTEHRAAFAKKQLPELRLGIIGVLGAQKAAAQLERLCAEAKVEINAAELSQITPRSDPPAAAAP